MVKRYCDMCGSVIKNRDYRILSLVDADRNFIQAQGKCVYDTIDNVELCRDCAGKILGQLIRDNDVFALTDEDGFPIT